MFRSILTLLIFVFLFESNAIAQTIRREMDNQYLEEIIKPLASDMRGEHGIWEATFDEYQVIIITDQTANRMRIFAPIVETKELKKNQMEKMMEANFDRALDAKYSTYNGYVVSVYAHPLKELHEDQLIDALNQVITLTVTFGDSYSSTGMQFGTRKEEQQKKL